VVEVELEAYNPQAQVVLAAVVMGAVLQ
jgi:hypothetical protein